MRILPFQRPTGNFALLLLFISALSSAFQLSSVHSLFSRLLSRRSLPASLITAPQGAVGYYQPPPGPITDAPEPTDCMAAPTSVREISHELRHESPTERSAASFRVHEASAIPATVTVTATPTQAVAAAASSGVANREAICGTAGILLSALVAVLQQL
ncbi:hypothetical protein VTN02DRAFT_310 [Thermoascus thermophilus]